MCYGPRSGWGWISAQGLCLCSLTWAPHPTGEGLGCGSACGSHSCPEGYCSNGGRCHLHPITCTPACACPPAFTDQHCLVAGGDFQPPPRAGGCPFVAGVEPQPRSPQSWGDRATTAASSGRSPPEKHPAAAQGAAERHCRGSQRHRTSLEGVGSGRGTHRHPGQRGSLGCPCLRTPRSRGTPGAPADLQAGGSPCQPCDTGGGHGHGHVLGSQHVKERPGQPLGLGHSAWTTLQPLPALVLSSPPLTRSRSPHHRSRPSWAPWR